MTKEEAFKEFEKAIDESNEMARKHLNDFFASHGCCDYAEYYKKYIELDDNCCKVEES